VGEGLKGRAEVGWAGWVEAAWAAAVAWAVVEGVARLAHTLHATGGKSDSCAVLHPRAVFARHSSLSANNSTTVATKAVI